MAGEDENLDENANIPPPVPPTQQATHTLSTIKLPIMNKGEYEIWAMKMEHYLGHTDYPIWEVIQKGNGHVQVSIDTNRQNMGFCSKCLKEFWLDTSSTNDVSNAYGVSTSSNHNSQKEGSSSYTDELIWIVTRDQEEPKALVTLDGDGVDWTGHAEDEQENFALIAYSNSGSDTEVTSCSKECVESYAKLNKLYDEQREQVGDASIEIQAYTQALKKVEAQLKLLVEAVKEKEELKTKLENFQSSSKGLSKLLNSQMSAKDKSRLGYGDQIHEGVSSYENEVLESVFDSSFSDVDDSPMNDRFAKVERMHAVPPPITGIYMPHKSDFGIDESKFTYGPKQSKTSEYDAKTSDFASYESNSSVETLESYESNDSDDEYMIKLPKEQEKPSFAFINTVKHEKTPRETVKEQKTCSPSPKADKRDMNILMSKKLGLGYGFTRKACFVCGSFNHLIRDCDFHEKRVAKQVELNKQKGKGTGQGENRPVWNNVPKIDHQNKRPFNRTTTPKANFINHKVNTARDKTVSAVEGNRETVVKALAGKIIKKNKVSLHDLKCLVLSPDFKLPDENQVLLRVPKQNNMYSFNLENIVPTGDLACLIAKVIVDESNKWHRRLKVL
ncbi:hypothetical protein Tco_0565227 [Tanacetum coccineum]